MRSSSARQGASVRSERRPAREPRASGRVRFRRIKGVLALLLTSLVVSIVLEWLGLLFWWEDEGLNHSVSMIETELGYLNADFTAGIGGSNPVQAVDRMAMTAYDWLFVTTHFEDALRWCGSQLGVFDFAMATITITQLFFIRLGILLFSLPTYVLAAVVGLSSGLTYRDIRRWSAGREYGRMFHFAKASAPHLLLASWFLYLSIPVAVHPNLVILPFALMFGVNVMIMAATYKKYL